MSDSSPQTEPYIREATSSDSPALSRICLLTGNAGQSAEAQHTFGELIGLVFAEPYVHLPTTFAFQTGYCVATASASMSVFPGI